MGCRGVARVPGSDGRVSLGASTSESTNGQPTSEISGQCTRETVQPRASGTWWLHPAGVVVLVVPATLVLAWIHDEQTYRQAWSTAKSLTMGTVVELAVVALTFVVASLITTFVARRRPTTPQWPALTPRVIAVLRRGHWWLFLGTLFGYAALVVAGLSRGARPADLLTRLTGGPVSADTIKEQFAPVTGITSLTQLGIGFVIVTALLLLVDPNRAMGVRLLVVLGLGLLRAFLLSERLAILELVLPLLAITVMAVLAATTSVVTRTIARLVPIVLIPLGLLLFAVFEYGRSWSFYRSRTDGSFLTFAGERFVGYYATAYNNGQLLISHGDSGREVPYLSIQGLWEAPGVATSGLYERLNHAAPIDWFWLLDAYANPEFNNQCGICLPVRDYGSAGAVVFFAAAAVLVTLAYLAFLQAHPVGLLVYPALFTGLWELPRYLYWTQGRLLPVLVVLTFIGLVCARTRDSRSVVLTRPSPPGFTWMSRVAVR